MAKVHGDRHRHFHFSTLMLRCAFGILIVSMLAAYISNRVEIANRQQELSSLQAQLKQQNEENEELQRVLEGNDDEILERIARDTYGYAAPNERVFVDMSGK
ncbi:MAG: septum formation initiator family protein [Faecalibacterium sp.]|nr:septum formation initiator family protein [Faecalibacterium sp.]